MRLSRRNRFRAAVRSMYRPGRRAALVVAVVGLALLWVDGDRTAAGRVACEAVPLIGFGIGAVMIARAVADGRRQTAREGRAGRRQCVDCGYDLRHLPADLRQCPECGRGFRRPEPISDAHRVGPGWQPSAPSPAPVTRPPARRKTLWMHDRSAPIEAFLAATAAKQPTPGGGSVAALAGALAAAIGEMVLNYSVGRKATAEHDDELKRVAHELATAREVLLELMVDDQEAYAALTAARKLAEPDRSAQLPAVVLACIRGPQATAATAAAVLGLCEQVVDHVNPWLLSDLAVCGDLATATVRAAGYNVRANLPSVADPAERQRLAAETDATLAHAVAAVQRLSPRIWARDAATTRAS